MANDSTTDILLNTECVRTINLIMKRDTIQSTNYLSRVAIITRNYYNTGGKQIDYFGTIKSKNVLIDSVA